MKMRMHSEPDDDKGGGEEEIGGTEYMQGTGDIIALA